MIKFLPGCVSLGSIARRCIQSFGQNLAWVEMSRMFLLIVQRHNFWYLVACRPSSHIAHSVLSSHLTTMGYFNFEALDLFCEFHSLWISKSSWLTELVSWRVQNFAHEINYRLRSVKRSSRNINVEHHLPLAWSHALMESKPYFPSSSERRCLSHRSRKERSSNWGVSHRGQVAHNDIKSLNCFKWNSVETSVKS